MTYFVSDIHGEYDLFLNLLDKIRFSECDTMYVLGDIIDKGSNSIKLVDFIRRQPNMRAILGNHEYVFLKYYYGLLRSVKTENDVDEVFRKLQNYFPEEKEKISWEAVEFIENLPFYIEDDDFICVHAGVETDENGIILPIKSQIPEVMVYSRNFKEKSFYLSSKNKTVLFGHTPCSYENDSGEFIKTPKLGTATPQRLADYAKIQLDCGVFLTGIIGALRLEDMQEFYVEKYNF